MDGQTDRQTDTFTQTHAWPLTYRCLRMCKEVVVLAEGVVLQVSMKDNGIWKRSIWFHLDFFVLLKL